MLLGSCDRATKLMSMPNPVFSFTDGNFDKNDWIQINPFNSNRSLIFYKKPVIMRYNTILNPDSNFNYSIDGKTPATDNSGYVYKVYNFIGFCGKATLDTTPGTSDYAKANEFLAKIIVKLNSSYTTGWGVASDYYDVAFTSSELNSLISGMPNATYFRPNNYSSVISGFSKDKFNGLLPSDEDAGINQDTNILFSNYLEYNVNKNFSPLGLWLIDLRFNTLFRQKITVNYTDYWMVIPPIFLFNYSNIFSTVDPYVYSLYRNGIADLNIFNTTDKAKLIVCPKPGSIMLTQNSTLTSNGSSYSANVCTLTYIGVEKVR